MRMADGINVWSCFVNRRVNLGNQSFKQASSKSVFAEWRSEGVKEIRFVNFGNPVKMEKVEKGKQEKWRKNNTAGDRRPVVAVTDSPRNQRG